MLCRELSSNIYSSLCAHYVKGERYKYTRVTFSGKKQFARYDDVDV